MAQLAPPRPVFIYEKHMKEVENRKEATSKACFLLSCFYTNNELKGTNLTGANDKKALDFEITGAIIGQYE